MTKSFQMQILVSCNSGKDESKGILLIFNPLEEYKFIIKRVQEKEERSKKENECESK